MKFFKTIETVVNLSPVEVYQDIDSIVLNKLRAAYKGRCESNCIILEVEEIVRRSKVRIEKASLKGAGFVNVCYRAKVLQLKPGEILPNCEVQRIEQNNQFTCKHKYASVYIAGSRDMQVLKEGQRVSVIIDEARHNKGMDKASVVGRIFEYPRTCIIYDVAGRDTEGDELVLKEWLDRIEALKVSKGPIVDHLRKAYYPFAEESKPPKGWEAKPITHVPAEGTFICRPPALEKSQAVYWLADSAAATRDPARDWNAVVQKERPSRALAELARDYYFFAVNLYKAAKRFDDKTLHEYSGLWLLYENRKR